MGVTVGLGCMVEGCETLSVWEAMGTGITGGDGGPWPKVVILFSSCIVELFLG